MAALEQMSRRFFKIYECKSTELVFAKDETHHAGRILNGILQLLLIDLPCGVCRKTTQSTLGMKSSWSQT